MKRAATKRNLTDRAKRYRAVKNVPGAVVCVFCGSHDDLQACHLSGDESHGERANLAWGCRSCNQKLSHAFIVVGSPVRTDQYNPAKGHVPTYEQYLWAVRNHRKEAHDEGGAIIHATPRHKRIEYARRIAGFVAKQRRARDDERWNPAADGSRRVYIEQLQDGTWQPIGSVRVYRESDAIRQYRREHPAFTRGTKLRIEKRRNNPVRRNPVDAAVEGFRDFHGHDPEVKTTVVEKVHRHRVLSGAGKLVSLRVLGIDGKGHTITKFRGALLAFSEARNQLFVKGGDQSVNLDDYGISEPHELETLGQVQEIGYHTVKSHLGSEGGEAIYVHEFRTTNENGRHVVVKVKRYPDLIYRVLDQQLEFSGGSYVIRREGIDF